MEMDPAVQSLILKGQYELPLTLPFNLIYYICFAGDMFRQFFGQGLQIAAVACVLAAVAVSALGAFLGIKISRELQKAGVLKR